MLTIWFSDMTQPIEFKSGTTLDALAKAGLLDLWQKREEDRKSVV